jgi:putative transposase
MGDPMPQSLSSVILHIIFSTKNREPTIDLEWEAELHAYLAAACKGEGCPTLQVGGAEDHVHLACALGRTIAIADLLGNIKKNSSKWVKRRVPRLEQFGWQTGYGAFSVGQSQVADLIAYIRNQREHHKRRSFKEEFLDLLRKYGVEFDERYLWD